MKAAVPREIINTCGCFEKRDRRATGLRLFASNDSRDTSDFKIIEPADQSAFDVLGVEVGDAGEHSNPWKTFIVLPVIISHPTCRFGDITNSPLTGKQSGYKIKVTKQLVYFGVTMKTKSELTREKILQAALYEFSIHGLAGARVDEIARSAGINKAMIYYHFESKEALFNQLFRSEMEFLKLEVTSLLQQRDTTSATDMTVAMKGLLEYVAGKKKLLTVLISETVRNNSQISHLFQLLDVTTAIGLEAVQKDGRKLPGENEPIFHELFSGLLPLIYYVLLRDQLRTYYGWKEETLDDRFIAYWLRHHGGY